jgi:NAD(P)-dependent dehydrogenase (short-subunit alcohol dehydrogenase family)
MEITLEGKVAVVTGASRGIGLAIAQRICEAGGDVLLVSRKAEGLTEAVGTLEGLKGAASWQVGHVGHPDDAQRTMEVCLERYGHIDILVNNAGTNPYMGPLIDIDGARMAKTVEINQSSIVHWTKAACVAGLGDGGGSVLNIASIGGLMPEPGIGWYNATKAAVIHLTKQLSWELAPAIRVNGIAPGLVKTELARAIWEEHEDRIALQIPMKRLGVPDDIATAALFLVSDEASWITGQMLVVDGGTTTQSSGGVG